MFGIATLDDGNKVRLAISYYGGYFKVIGKGGGYRVSGESSIVYDRVLNEAVNSFIWDFPFDPVPTTTVGLFSIIIYRSHYPARLSQLPNHGFLLSPGPDAEHREQ